MGDGLQEEAVRLRYDLAWQAVGWLGVLIVVVLSLRPQPPHLPSVLGWDKAQHALAYAMLTWWFVQVCPRPGWSAVGMLALGAGLEVAQRLTPHRTFDYADLLADGVGVALGFVATLTLLGRVVAWMDERLGRVLDLRRRRRGD